ncbi:hypothetical protein N9V96_03900 [Polaribacter sp.]|nr:hypothetical protein [Polaribacter sp.]
MKKLASSVLLKKPFFLRKNKAVKTPKDYTVLVENFKAKLQVE